MASYEMIKLSAKNAKAQWCAMHNHTLEYANTIQEGGWRGWYLIGPVAEGTIDMIGPFKTGKEAIDCKRVWEIHYGSKY